MSIFSKVAFRKPQQSRFNMSSDVKFTMNMGELTPIFCEETLPGDRWRLSIQMLMRMAPMIAPVMHKVNVYQHWFFVPNRITFPQWNDFIYQTKPGFVPPVWPYLQGTSVVANDLSNCLGMPITSEMPRFTALKHAGYQKIWNDFFRDENLEPEIDVTLSPGSNNSKMGTLMPIRKRAWTKDYFTSALPFAQKGDAVQIPLAGEFNDVSVYYNGNTEQPAKIITEDNNLLGSDWPVYAEGMDGENPSTGYFNVRDGSSGSFHNARYDPADSLSAKTSDLELESTTIENLRVAVTMQEWLELAARGGTRPNEASLAFFGVKSSDGRLQRPDYLGGSMSPMSISEVLQTAQGTGEDPTPQGNMAGHGVSSAGGNYIDYFCEEHGFLYCLVSILPKTAYQQGVHRSWTRQDKFDYAWPTFANLGEQAVLNQEVYWDPNDELNEATFGYQSRYAEYKHCQDRVFGNFANSLDFWHMGRIFPFRPALNGQFVASDPTERIFAVSGDGTAKIWCWASHNASVARKLPKYGIPKFS